MFVLWADVTVVLAMFDVVVRRMYVSGEGVACGVGCRFVWVWWWVSAVWGGRWVAEYVWGSVIEVFDDSEDRRDCFYGLV